MRAMAGRIGFVLPPAGALPSGGHGFNRALLACAASAGAPWAALSPAAHALRAQPWALLLWDSLLLDRVERLGHETVALLLHYLPSLQPGLDACAAGMLRAIEQRAAAQADALIVVSKELAAAIAARWPEKRVFVCEPGVSAVFRQRPERAAQAPPTLLTVANLLPAKGHAGLVDVLARLRHLDWHWHVIGHGGAGQRAAARLRRQARRMGLADRSTLHGALDQDAVAAWMARADVLLQPSLFESYGMALAEACAVGLPAVSFDVGAAGRLIADGMSGYVVAARDWDAFTRRLDRLLAEPALRASFERALAQTPVRRWERAYADLNAAFDALRREA